MSIERKRVLVVDDDEAISKTFQAILKAAGFTVDTATSGKEAIAKCKTHYYNLALLDIKLPDIQGTELLPKIKEIDPSTVKIMVTGNASIENTIQSLNYGADGYLVKPVDPQTLLEVILEKLWEQEIKSTKQVRTRSQGIETVFTKYYG